MLKKSLTFTSPGLPGAPETNGRLREMVHSGLPTFGLVRFVVCECGAADCPGVAPEVLDYRALVPMPDGLAPEAQRIGAAFIAHQFEGELRRALADEFGTAGPSPGNGLAN